MQLYNFFVNQSYPYRAGDVEMCFNETDSSIIISSAVPGYEQPSGELELTLHGSYENLFAFASEFLITAPSEVQHITSQLLYKMFLLGRCSLYCDLDGNLEHYLLFKRLRGGYVATNNNEEEHAVPEQVGTVYELIIYTQHYYEKLFA